MIGAIPRCELVRRLAGLIVFGVVAGSGFAPAHADPATHAVVDMSGASVTVPVTIERIAEQFPAHTATDIMLGVGDRLVAIPQNVKTIPFLRKVYPRIAAVPEIFKPGGSFNVEELLARRPDVVSVLGSGAALKPFETAGLPAVNMLFATFDGLSRSIVLAGEVYGGEAKARAAAYVDYFRSKHDMIKSRLADLPAERRPTVVHIASFPPLVVDGGNSLIDEWITLAGGNDAARGIAGAHAVVTIEQLLKWNPDVLIVQTPGGDQGLSANTGRSVIAALSSTPGWQGLKAVKTGRVYSNPQGLYPWERYGPEEALQIQWAAKTLHPDRFADIDIRAESRTFYRTFFGYSLDDAELDQILQTGQ